MTDLKARSFLWLTTVLAGVSLAASSATCAPTAPYNPDQLPTAQIGRIGAICHSVMGLPAGPYRQYQACEKSLSHSLAARRDANAITMVRQACEARGLKPQTVALADCELHPPAQMLAQTDSALDAPPAAPAKPIRSYFSASNDEIRQREQEACAQIGEDPATGAFAECVADLRSTLLASDNPMH